MKNSELFQLTNNGQKHFHFLDKHFEFPSITVFDPIIAGDTMQNVKLRVDFYYS